MRAQHMVISFLLALQSASALALPLPLRVLSYNIWGLPSPIDTAPWRYIEIAKRLEAYDVISIQEAWDAKTDILWKLRRSHPYIAFGRRPHGLLGASGIMILSKLPIFKVGSISYSDCKFTDCLESKGAVAARIEVKPGVEVDVYTTHLNAHDRYASMRSTQIAELMRFVNEFSGEKPFILTGDFNSDFLTENYHELMNGLSLRDSYNEYVQKQTHPTPEQLAGATYDPFSNAWANPRVSSESRSKRYDYIFSRDTDRLRLSPVESHVCFKETVTSEQGEGPLSDHYGITTLFHIDTP